MQIADTFIEKGEPTKILSNLLESKRTVNEKEVEQGIVIKLLAREGVNPAEILERLEKIPFQGTDYLHSIKNFLEVHGETENIDVVFRHKEQNRQITLFKIVEEVNIRYENVQKIVPDNLEFR